MCLAAAACSPAEDDAAERLSVGARLSADTSGYATVTEPRTLRFPADHGPHPRYKHEWWYLTGQLQTDGGRRFGFQLTVFREAIAPEAPDSPSRWATNQLYLAHAAVTDVQGERYLSDERFARGALGLADASASPFRVRLENWRLAGDVDDAGNFRGRAAAESGEFGFDLTIRNRRPPVAHGDRGLSVKGPEGDASYYYSYTRLDAEGTVRVDDRTYRAAGDAWFDHEWSSSTLQADQTGWDWFSLQLSDGSELMLFRLRHVSDPARDFHSGTFVDASGRVVGLSSEQITMEAQSHWTSDRTGVRYPSRWRLSVPDAGLTLVTEPWLQNQEFAHSFRYWEGAVRISGTRDGEPIRGNGYAELAGYGSESERR